MYLPRGSVLNIEAKDPFETNPVNPKVWNKIIR